MKTALQEYNDFNPQIGERVIVRVENAVSGGYRETDAEIVELMPETAQVGVLFPWGGMVQRFGPSSIRRQT